MDDGTVWRWGWVGPSYFATPFEVTEVRDSLSIAHGYGGSENLVAYNADGRVAWVFATSGFFFPGPSGVGFLNLVYSDNKQADLRVTLSAAQPTVPVGGEVETYDFDRENSQVALVLDVTREDSSTDLPLPHWAVSALAALLFGVGSYRFGSRPTH